MNATGSTKFHLTLSQKCSDEVWLVSLGHDRFHLHFNMSVLWYKLVLIHRRKVIEGWSGGTQNILSRTADHWRMRSLPSSYVTSVLHWSSICSYLHCVAAWPCRQQGLNHKSFSFSVRHANLCTMLVSVFFSVVFEIRVAVNLCFVLTIVESCMYQPTRMLRSSTAHFLQWPLVLTSVASRAFTVAAPTVWNSLSVNTRSADSWQLCEF